MLTSLRCIGIAALVFGAVGQKQYRPSGSSSSGVSSSGSSSRGSVSSTASGNGILSSGVNGGSSSGIGGGSPSSVNGGKSFGGGASGSGFSDGGKFNSPSRPAGSGGFGGGNKNQDGSFQGGSASGKGSLEETIPGVPGDDYPIYSEIPDTSFSCEGQVHGGYYANTETECQVFHVCATGSQGELTKYDFICPNGTIFDQQYMVCSWWFNVDCSLAEDLYSINNDIAAERELNAAQAAKHQSQQFSTKAGNGQNVENGSRGGDFQSSSRSNSNLNESSFNRNNGIKRKESKIRAQETISSDIVSGSRPSKNKPGVARNQNSKGSKKATGTAVSTSSKGVNTGKKRGSFNRPRPSSFSNNKGSFDGSRNVSNRKTIVSQGRLGNGYEGVGAPGFGGEGPKFSPSSGYGAPGGTFADNSYATQNDNTGLIGSSVGNAGGQQHSGSQSVNTGYGAPPGGNFDGSSGFGNDNPLTSYSRSARDIEYFTDFFTDVWKLQ